MTLVTDSGKFARSVTHFLKLKIPKNARNALNK